jgi:hypothetical protein
MTFELCCTHFSGEQLKAIADVLPNEIYLVLLLNEMILHPSLSYYSIWSW